MSNIDSQCENLYKRASQPRYSLSAKEVQLLHDAAVTIKNLDDELTQLKKIVSCISPGVFLKAKEEAGFAVSVRAKEIMRLKGG